MLRAIIVDDEKASRKSLQKLLKDYPQVELIDEAQDGLEAVQKIEEKKPDLVFLDIQMPGLNGFEVVHSLTGESRPKIIFVTAFDQYAVKAFEVSALDYLLKPIEESRLRQTMEKLLQEKNSQSFEYESIRRLLLNWKEPRQRPLHLLLRRGKKIVLMNPEEIIYIRSEQGVTIVMTQSGEYWSSYILAAIEGLLDDQIFFRSHRSTIVNLNRVREITPSDAGTFDIWPACPEKIRLPLSRDRAKVLRDRYNF
jgi:DNA-binding LytR/AlgR family response regulator